MNEYEFDYMNYLMNVPSSMNYSGLPKVNMNYNQGMNPSMNYIPEKQAKMKMMENTRILAPEEGFMRGNLFGNLYDSYKNYKPALLNPTNEREALLYQVLQYKFALTDLGLYLDTHPNDMEAINLYNKYLDIEKQVCMKYESMYGPLTLDSNYLNSNTWVWNNSPWPWEGV